MSFIYLFPRLSFSWFALAAFIFQRYSSFKSRYSLSNLCGIYLSDGVAVKSYQQPVYPCTEPNYNSKWSLPDTKCDC